VKNSQFLTFLGSSLHFQRIDPEDVVHAKETVKVASYFHLSYTAQRVRSRPESSDSEGYVQSQCGAQQLREESGPPMQTKTITSSTPCHQMQVVPPELDFHDR
jgi:hypothetical protein